MASDSIFKPTLLHQQNAFITGGSSGLNKGIASRLIEHGANIVIVARNQERLDQVCQDLQKVSGGQLLTVSADVRDFNATQKAAQAGVDAFGRYDIVIAGVAGNFLAPAEEMSSNAFAAVVDIDLKGTFHAFRVCYEHLNSDARMLAISAPQSVNPQPLLAHVCAAKAGIDNLVKALALEWGHNGIRINGIIPSFIKDTLGAEIMTDNGTFSDLAEDLGLAIPRMATIDEIADIALFMLSPANAYMTGHILAFDGGLSAGSAKRLSIPEQT